MDLLCPPPHDFAVAPVPASRLLWRAETEIGLEEQLEKGNSIHGILRNGDLVKLKHGLDEEHWHMRSGIGGTQGQMNLVLSHISSRSGINARNIML